MISNIKKGTTCTSLNWSEFKRIIIIRFRLLNKDMFFVILVSLTAVMSKKNFSAAQEILKVIKIFTKRTCVCME